ncbi:MAG: tRNA (uridine(34)/cytosine(34)/5-carboxymethylaminomethyluridine(34)-2'-O)-methyltransferase TrmL [Legionellales bacterium]|nr:tRNA (uridine(34)/cytosine(34)/5-carboxymethylaminomethyluridine(34)-2'-O)-methyltransferase TrmL [Legionellales bacterium]
MFHIALFEPEIPPNTGNIIRLCANTGAQLHLIEPLGFTLTDRQLKRAGLDYHEWAALHVHSDFESLLENFSSARLFACSTKGTTYYTTPHYQPGDLFLFGPESRGLPAPILQNQQVHDIIRIPMRESSRSLNLANAASIILYEAWRQQDFS